MKITKTLSLALALCLLLGGCGGAKKDELHTLCTDVGLNLNSARVLSDDDSHGGFHGDGVRLAVICFDEAADEALLESADGWSLLPLSDAVSRLLYEQIEGIYPSDARMARVANGWWYFLDRAADQSRPLNARYSYNFTAAIYDADTNTLYYCKVDT